MKTIYKITLTAFLFLCYISTVFAESSITLSTDNETPQLGETFTVEVQIEFDSLEPISTIRIPGIEAFEQFSVMQQESSQVSGTQVQKTSSIIFWLKPKDEGDFEIWPISADFSGATISSNTLYISVWSGSLNSSSQIKPNIKKTEQKKEQNVKNTEKEWRNQEIKWLKKTHLTWTIIPIILVLFLGGFYFLVQLLLSQSKKTKKQQELPQEIPNYKKELQKIKKRIETLSKTEFYTSLHSIIRKYFSQSLGIRDAETLTLSEIKPLLEKHPELLKLFSLSYTHEFNEKRGSVKIREKTLEDYIQLF